MTWTSAYRRSFWNAARGRHVATRSLEPLPPFELRDTEGRIVRSRDLTDRPTVLVVSSPHCAPCAALYPALRDLSTEAVGVRFVLLSRGARSTNLSLRIENRLGRVLVLGSRKEVEGRLGVSATPYAVLVSPDGHVFWKGVVDARVLHDLVEAAEHPLIAATG